MRERERRTDTIQQNVLRIVSATILILMELQGNRGVGFKFTNSTEEEDKKQKHISKY